MIVQYNYILVTHVCVPAALDEWCQYRHLIVVRVTKTVYIEYGMMITNSYIP